MRNMKGFADGIARTTCIRRCQKENCDGSCALSKDVYCGYVQRTVFDILDELVGGFIENEKAQ